MRTVAPQGLRAVDPRRDLRGLADLIETAFAESLDPSGRRMVGEMRRFGRFGWLGWLVGHLFLPPAAYPDGFVWEHERHLVGNASLMRVEGDPGRWVLANVAVLPAFRRRGLGRRLVGACIDLAVRKGASEIILQVKADNQAAQDLYRDFGFVPRSTRSSWRRGPGAAVGSWLPKAGARLRRPVEWTAQFDLARQLIPEGMVWPHPLRASLFRPGGWVGGDGWRHWVWPAEGALQAWLSLRLESAGVQLYLVASPEASGQAEEPLLNSALREPGLDRTPISLDIAGGTGDAPTRLGFTLEHRLTWMSRPAPTRGGPSA